MSGSAVPGSSRSARRARSGGAAAHGLRATGPKLGSPRPPQVPRGRIMRQSRHDPEQLRSSTTCPTQAVRRRAQCRGQRPVGRPVRTRPLRHHAGHQRLDRVRPQDVAPGHPRQPGPCRHAGPRRGHRRAETRPPSAPAWTDRRRDRRRPLPLRRSARRHPHEHRGAAGRAHRRGRQAPAHRRAAATTRSRPISASGCATRSTGWTRRSPTDAGAGRPRGRARGRSDAGLHPSADGPAGHVRASPAGLCRDAGAGPRPPRRCARAG